MKRTKQVSLVVTPETHERWQEAVDDNPEYGSVADLIRTGVTNELAEGADNQEVDLSPLLDKLDTIETKQNQTQNQLTGVQQSINQEIEDQLEIQSAEINGVRQQVVYFRSLFKRHIDENIDFEPDFGYFTDDE